MIQIDKEFQALIPPLAAEEKAQLEAISWLMVAVIRWWCGVTR